MASGRSGAKNRLGLFALGRVTGDSPRGAHSPAGERGRESVGNEESQSERVCGRVKQCKHSGRGDSREGVTPLLRGRKRDTVNNGEKERRTETERGKVGFGKGVRGLPAEGSK